MNCCGSTERLLLINDEASQEDIIQTKNSYCTNGRQHNNYLNLLHLIKGLKRQIFKTVLMVFQKLSGIVAVCIAL